MRSVIAAPWIVLCVWALALSCGSRAGEEQANEGRRTSEEVHPMEDLDLRSTAFRSGEEIPRKYTCDGADLSPPLEWKKPPSGAKSVVLIVDDPDAPAGTWTHWLVWGLRPDTTSLPEGVTNDRILSTDARQGKNDFGRIGYGGPCPPRGPAHRYYFRIYAIDTVLSPGSDPKRTDVLKAIDTHVLAKGELLGRYARAR
ncbi:MAG: YbhB/YbcL family Raf kinase inhibitor-like protein [Candidatus Eisenbacteria bacterium]|nr:YbhB/YbcL family Raf kinase inhibitor-like protein [Candidatus Eisenbacteria bacterium]